MNQEFWRLLWKTKPKSWALAGVLNIINALVSVATIAYINRVFLSGAQVHAQTVMGFAGWVVLLLITTFVSGFYLTYLGHKLVFELRRQLVKQLIDSELITIEHIGSAKILASLSDDIQTVTMAFVRLPELAQGVVVCLVAGIYLAGLSPSLLAVVAVYVGLMLWLCGRLVHHVYQHLADIRQKHDELYEDYEAVIHGKKEMTLSHQRRYWLYHQRFLPRAQKVFDASIKADTFHLSAVNFSNIAMFALIGVIFMLSSFWQIPLSVAGVFTLTVLFIQGLLLKALGAYPTINAAAIALTKIKALTLTTYQETFDTSTALTWQQIQLHAVGYTYPKGGFALAPTDFTLNKGETVFLIGANGSGKSTFAHILTALYEPSCGQITVDGNCVTRTQYQALFSAVYSDFYLFDTILSDDTDLITTWLTHLQMHQKLIIEQNVIQNTQLSQGQKKRVALLLALCENKDILLLDEWAADQGPVFRQVFYETLLPLLSKMGKTLLVISHDHAYFHRADRLFEMRQGVLKELTGENKVRASKNAVAHLLSETDDC